MSVAAAVLPPLYVDLDGTLIATDLLHESALRLLRIAPLEVLRMPGWLMQGKAFLKHQIAQRVKLDIAALPYRASMLELIRRERASGRRIVLATASDGLFARQVADHLGLFDDVLASDGASNLSGRRKLDAIQANVETQPFCYAGDGTVDLAVWSGAESAVVVSRSGGLLPRVQELTRIEAELEVSAPRLRDYLYGMRLHQWLKNLLVLVPLLPMLGAATPAMLAAALSMFFCFSLCASAIYVFNDLLDLEADRQHPRKRLRPFASGVIPIGQGVVLGFALLAVAAALALATLPAAGVGVLAGYVALTTVYSVWAKRMVLVDVFVLAALYTMRILAGAAAMQVPATFWILGFSVFIFLSLALAKRYVELGDLRRSGRTQIKDRGYTALDDVFVLAAGISAGQLSIMTLSLYLHEPAVSQRYAHPHFLWMLCPMLLFWLTRVWLKAHRGELHDDPVVFAARDRVSRGVLLVCVALAYAAA